MNKEEFIKPEIWEHYNIKTFDISKTNQVYDLILKMWDENKQLKEHIEKYEHYCKTTGIEELQQENKKYKEIFDKIDKYINGYNVFEVFSFPLMKRWEEEQVKSSIDYEFKTSLIKDLKNILKEVE